MHYKIGEFSKITQLSIKTLRYYHEMNILVPSDIDEESGYRFYDEQSYERAKLIKLLREFDFAIKEIQEILDTYEDEDDIKAYLLEKNDLIQQKISHYKKLQEKIMDYQTYKEVKIMLNQVQKIKVEPMLIASMTYVGKYQDVGEYLGKLFKSVGMNVKGKPFSIYHDDDYKEDNATVEVCIPIKKEISYQNIDTKTIPGGEALSLLHVGPYDTLSDSYKVITDYLKENNIEQKYPTREHYIKGPGMLLKGNPNKYQTEIRILI